MELKEKVINIQDPEGYSRCIDNYKNKKKIDGVQIIDYYELKNSELENKFINGISGILNAETGNTYIYINGLGRYIINSENIEFESYRYQCYAFLDFIRKLGAKDFEHHIHIKKNKKSFFSNIFGGKFGGTKADVTVKSEEEKDLEAELNLKSYFQKVEERFLLTNEEYDAARKIYESTPILFQNIDCKTLLKGRKPGENNQIKQYSVTFKLSEELQSSIDVAAKFSKLKIVKVKNDTNYKTNIKRSVEVRFTVMF